LSKFVVFRYIRLTEVAPTSASEFREQYERDLQAQLAPTMQHRTSEPSPLIDSIIVSVADGSAPRQVSIP